MGFFKTSLRSMALGMEICAAGALIGFITGGPPGVVSGAIVGGILGGVVAVGGLALAAAGCCYDKTSSQDNAFNYRRPSRRVRGGSNARNAVSSRQTSNFRGTQPQPQPVQSTQPDNTPQYTVQFIPQHPALVGISPLQPNPENVSQRGDMPQRNLRRRR